MKHAQWHSESHPMENFTSSDYKFIVSIDPIFSNVTLTIDPMVSQAFHGLEEARWGETFVPGWDYAKDSNERW